MFFKKKYYLCTLKIKVVSVAQLAEQMTLNHWAESSNLSGDTFFLAIPLIILY
jgi:hypothetical protein